MKTHSLIGPSSADRFFACPGSVRLSRTLPANQSTKTSKYAAEGTVAHGIAERYIKAFQDGDFIRLDRFLDDEVTQDGHDIIVTEEMLEAVTVYVDKIYDDLKGLKDYVFGIEEKISLPHISPDAYGTCDAFLYSNGVLKVYDFKYGSGVSVAVDDNKQLMYYAAGFLKKFPDARTIELIIVQPRGRGDQIKSVLLPRLDIAGFQGDLTMAIQRIEDPNAPFATGAHCRFCPALAICPEQRKDVEAKTLAQFTEHVTTTKLSDPKLLTESEISNILQHSEMIKSWLSAVEGYALTLAETGVDIPGYKLVDKQGNRKWTDESKVLLHYKAEFGDALYTKKIKSPAQLEKLIGTKRKDELTELVERPFKGSTLVPIADSRQNKTTVKFEPIKETK